MCCISLFICISVLCSLIVCCRFHLCHLDPVLFLSPSSVLFFFSLQILLHFQFFVKLRRVQAEPVREFGFEVPETVADFRFELRPRRVQGGSFVGDRRRGRVFGCGCVVVSRHPVLEDHHSLDKMVRRARKKERRCRVKNAANDDQKR